MDKELDRLEGIWRNEFAITYKDKPRLYNTIKGARLDIKKDEIDSGINIVFYLLNEVQCTWVNEKMLSQMQERFAQLADLDNLTLSADVDAAQEIRIIDTTPHPPVEMTDTRDFEPGIN